MAKRSLCLITSPSQSSPSAVRSRELPALVGDVRLVPIEVLHAHEESAPAARVPTATRPPRCGDCRGGDRRSVTGRNGRSRGRRSKACRYSRRHGVSIVRSQGQRTATVLQHVWRVAARCDRPHRGRLPPAGLPPPTARPTASLRPPIAEMSPPADGDITTEMFAPPTGPTDHHVGDAGGDRTGIVRRARRCRRRSHPLANGSASGSSSSRRSSAPSLP